MQVLWSCDGIGPAFYLNKKNPQLRVFMCLNETNYFCSLANFSIS